MLTLLVGLVDVFDLLVGSRAQDLNENRVFGAKTLQNVRLFMLALS